MRKSSATFALPALLGCSLAILSGCASPTIAQRNSPADMTPSQKMGQVVDQPLSDLNLSSTEIPPALIQASLAPYALAAAPSCTALQQEVDQLTTILGPDIEPAKVSQNGAIISKRTAGEAAWGTARGVAEGWIPFHGVVRVLSGAQEHDQTVQHAILAGFVRRAFLEGVRAGRFCQ